MEYTNAKPVRVSGWKARAYVQNGINFTNNNKQLFGRWETPSLYVVYSYGTHWPLFMWDNGEWWENEDKYSRTTTKHRSQTHPHVDTSKGSRTYLKHMIANRINEHRSNLQMERLQHELLAA